MILHVTDIIYFRQSPQDKLSIIIFTILLNTKKATFPFSTGMSLFKFQKIVYITLSSCLPLQQIGTFKEMASGYLYAVTFLIIPNLNRRTTSHTPLNINNRDLPFSKFVYYFTFAFTFIIQFAQLFWSHTLQIQCCFFFHISPVFKLYVYYDSTLRHHKNTHLCFNFKIFYP